MERHEQPDSRNGHHSFAHCSTQIHDRFNGYDTHRLERRPFSSRRRHRSDHGERSSAGSRRTCSQEHGCLFRSRRDWRDLRRVLQLLRPAGGASRSGDRSGRHFRTDDRCGSRHWTTPGCRALTNYRRRRPRCAGRGGRRTSRYAGNDPTVRRDGGWIWLWGIAITLTVSSCVRSSEATACGARGVRMRTNPSSDLIFRSRQRRKGGCHAHPPSVSLSYNTGFVPEN